MNTILRTRRPESRRQRGVALMMCIFALLLLSGIAMGLMFMADTETIINENYRSAQQSFMAATAGLEEVRERLMATSANPIAPPIVMPGQNGAVIYVRNPMGGELVDPADPGNGFFDSQLCKENFSGLGLTNTGPHVPCASGPAGTDWFQYENSAPAYSAAGLSYKWVRLTLKANNTRQPYCVNGNCADSPDRQVCWNGTAQVLLPAGWAHCGQEPAGNELYLRPVHILTSLAITPPMAGRPGARRMSQMEVAFQPPMITNAAVSSQADVVFAGNPTVDGYDQCSCLCLGYEKRNGKDICTEYVDRPGKVCDRTKFAIYSENEIGGEVGKVPPTVIAGTDPVVSPNSDWEYDIPALIERYKPGAVAPYGLNCPGGNCGTQTQQQFGTLPIPFPPLDPNNPIGGSPQITYVGGDLILTAHSVGNGILIVDGDLRLHGGLEFYGLILVRGTFTFTGQGGDVGIHGAVLAGESALVNDDDTMLGGAANIHFDRCALARDFSFMPPSRLAFREVFN
jgi:hypothetical protein